MDDPQDDPQDDPAGISECINKMLARDLVHVWPF